MSTGQVEALSRLEQAQLLSGCTRLSWGEFYCLGFGYRDTRPDYRELLGARSGEGGGDLSFSEWLSARAAMPEAARLRAQGSEVRGALRGLGKALALAQQ